MLHDRRVRRLEAATLDILVASPNGHILDDLIARPPNEEQVQCATWQSA
jgi:hypothetical protein